MFDHAEFEATGRAWIRNAVPLADLEQLAAGIELKGRAGNRPATGSPLTNYFLQPNPVSSTLTGLALDQRPVRLAVFDKTQETNWAVPWHQDRVIAVTGRHDLPGYTAWLPKQGYWHVEPPAALFDSMVFIRLHIDAADESNGCLQLALGSHKSGRIPASDAADLAEHLPVETCVASPGDVLIVKALTLHRSASSRSTAPRRALRIDYADRSQLPSPLAWAI